LSKPYCTVIEQASLGGTYLNDLAISGWFTPASADERVIERLQQQGKMAVIPPKRNRTTPRDYDKNLYKARHLIENFFATLKQYRAIATRYDKRANNFLSAILSGCYYYLA